MSATADSLVVLHVESPNRGRQGDHIYRTLQPCRALGQRPNVTVVSGSLLSPALARTGLWRTADLLLLCDVVDADFLPVIAGRRRERKLTGYEINDHFLAPQPWNPTAYLATNLLSRSLSSQLARQADWVQFTVDELQRRFGHLNARRVIFPNHLWQMPAPVARAPAQGEEITVGWGGSLGHREDLRWMVPALRAFLARHPKARLAIMGDPSFRELFSWTAPGQLTFTPGGSIDAYYQFLRELDVGLAPLLPTEFNLCRSDVKFLEYAAHGVLGICADLAPYRATVRPGENGLLFADQAGLEAALTWAATHPDERRALAERARQMVAEQRLERPHAAERLDQARSVAGELGYSTTGAPGREIPGGGWTFADGHYLDASGDPVEALLYDGLRYQQAGHAADARRCFQEATRAAADFYVGWMFLGSATADSAQALPALRRALQLNPDSCNALFLLGTQLQAAGELAQAVDAFSRCRALAPELGAAQVRLAELAQAAGQTSEAVTLYEEAMQLNSSFALPVARLAVLALTDGKPERAVELLGRSLKDDPALWLTNFLIGRAHVDQKQFQTARQHLQQALEVGAEDRPAVLAQLAKAELGLGNVATARAIMEELRTLTAGRPS